MKSTLFVSEFNSASNDDLKETNKDIVNVWNLVHLFSELLVSLKQDLCSDRNTTNDTQIDLLLEQTEEGLQASKENFLLTFTTETFKKFFSELIQYIQESFQIMSIIFKSNNPIGSNIGFYQILQEFDGSDEILVTESHWIPTVSDPASDFFTWIILKSDVDYTKLSLKYSSVSTILDKIAEQFGTDGPHMLIYLRQKEMSDKNFHLTEQLGTYVRSTTTAVYDINEFSSQLYMHNLDHNDYIFLAATL
ncbi:unnamed protein product [Adineta ricciae]|uniref:Uncharacterized protein n=1 Tax=Adineta ricciae TaxID=249248 RepID=A0A814T760_ADIRI|nr:unnamed protein product [Adineta ricciae]